METLFTDSLNWLVYERDENNEIWLTDYPDSAAHWGGRPRVRKILLAPQPKVAFEALLGCLRLNEQVLHENAQLTTPHLVAIGQVAASLTPDGSPEPALASAKRTFGWSFLPGDWGATVEYAWARYCSAAESSA